MGAVFEATGFDGRRRRRGRGWATTRPIAALRHRPPGHALRPRDPRRRPSSLRGSEFKVFEGVLGGGGVVRAINAGAREMSRSELDGLNEVVQRPRRQGRRADLRRATAAGPATSRSSSRAEQIAAVNAELGASDGDLLLFVADQREVARGVARRRCGSSSASASG